MQLFGRCDLQTVRCLSIQEKKGKIKYEALGVNL